MFRLSSDPFLLPYPHLGIPPSQIPEPIFLDTMAYRHMLTHARCTHLCWEASPTTMHKPTSSSHQMPTDKLAIYRPLYKQYVHKYVYLQSCHTGMFMQIHTYLQSPHISTSYINHFGLKQKTYWCWCAWGSHVLLALLSFGSAMSNMSLKEKRFALPNRCVSPCETWWFEVNAAIPYMQIIPILLKKLWFIFSYYPFCFLETH